MKRELFLGLCAAMSMATCVAFADEVQPKNVLKFDFGTGQTADGYIAVGEADKYDDVRGYGLESDANISSVVRKKGDKLTQDYLTADGLFKFSVKLPEGNYRVTVTLGDTEGTSLTTVKAEERRLMVERRATEKKEIVTESFLVNIRTPQLSPGNKMKLDVREWDPVTDKPVTATWDERLTLRFSDENPCVCGVTIEPVEDVITVFVMGDSTVTDQVTEPYGTWGQHLTRWFRGPVVIANHAESGQTAKGFRFQRRWDKILDQIKEGDYVFMQFGHNDLNQRGHDAMWAVEDNAGNWINTYADALTDYKWALATFALEVKRHGAIPVIVSPMTKLNMRTGELNIAGMREYPQGAREAAELAECAFVDLNAMSVTLAEALGKEQAPKAYVDGLHSNTYGGYMFARCVIKGIKEAGLPIAEYLTEDALDFDPANPKPLPAEYTVPVDPMVEVPMPPGMRMPARR